MTIKPIGSQVEPPDDRQVGDGAPQPGTVLSDGVVKIGSVDQAGLFVAGDGLLVTIPLRGDDAADGVPSEARSMADVHLAIPRNYQRCTKFCLRALHRENLGCPNVGTGS